MNARLVHFERIARAANRILSAAIEQEYPVGARVLYETANKRVYADVIMHGLNLGYGEPRMKIRNCWTGKEYWIFVHASELTRLVRGDES